MPVRHGGTFEINAGAAVLFGGGDSAVVHGIGGLNLGVGGFITPKLALSMRLAGATVLEDAIIYLGFVGPSLQAWLSDQVWIGGGIGVGFLAGCAEGGCGSFTSAGYDLRIGVAFDKTGHTNASVEMTTLDAGGPSLHILSVLLGAQSF